MSPALQSATIECPYCGVGLEILIDNSYGDHEYIEDCQVCCSPIEISAQFASNGELTMVQCKRDAD